MKTHAMSKILIAACLAFPAVAFSQHRIPSQSIPQRSPLLDGARNAPSAKLTLPLEITSIRTADGKPFNTSTAEGTTFYCGERYDLCRIDGIVADPSNMVTFSINRYYYTPSNNGGVGGELKQREPESFYIPYIRDARTGNYTISHYISLRPDVRGVNAWVRITLSIRIINAQKKLTFERTIDLVPSTGRHEAVN